MDGIIAERLAEFAARVREMNEAVNTARGKEAERLGAELSAFIGQRTQALTAEGLTVMKIQEALRAAVYTQEQTLAPDAEISDDADSGERLEAPLSETTYFLPMEGSVIDAFADGLFNAGEMVTRICERSADIVPIEMTEGLELLLGSFGPPEMPDSLSGGEVVRDVKGEAFVPEYLGIHDEDGGEYIVCDPMVFKTAKEALALSVFLEAIDRKLFYQKVNLKKLLKADWLSSYDKRSLKKNAENIIRALWEDFLYLRGVYRKAARQKKGIAIFAGYEGAKETGDSDNSIVV